MPKPRGPGEPYPGPVPRVRGADAGKRGHERKLGETAPPIPSRVDEPSGTNLVRTHGNQGPPGAEERVDGTVSAVPVARQ
ncbi:hypothetical protein GCM10007079_15730 [Nocardiopsis terrae]|nr:hypothetical protein GCM10007079_15730 [Nocardiopsis terrae]